ncbi:MAG: restriction endonuclease subunit S [Bacteroidota bacterium]
MKVKGNIKTLEEVCSFIRGVVFAKNEEIETTDGFGILRSHNVDFENYRVSLHDLKYISPNAKVKDEQRLRKNDILISVANSKEQTGKVGFSFSDTKYYAGGFMAIMRPLNGINPYYLFANLSTHNFKQFIEGKNQGTTNIWNITFTRIKDYEFIVPDSDKQNLIAELFQGIETAIKQAEQQEKNLLKIKNSLLNKLIDDNNEWGNFNKKNWTKIKFSDVVNNLNKTEKNPLAKGLTKAIGLENINPNDLKIQNYVDIEKLGTKFSRVFKKGQYLFGARRAYLKQMALADFDGVCTANIMVFDLKNHERMLKDYIALIIQSDVFINYATNTSVGSLFPNAKWKAIAEFVFPLPDLKAQEKIVEMFQQIEIILSQLKTQKQTLKNLKQKLLNDILG